MAKTIYLQIKTEADRLMVAQALLKNGYVVYMCSRLNDNKRRETGLYVSRTDKPEEGAEG